MKTVVIGLNHKTADVDLREKLAFNGPKLEEGIRQIRALPEIRETIIISTCNRVEIYLTVKDVAKAFESVKDFFVRFFEIRKESLDNALYLYDDMQAVRHIFRVSSSLDSMVVGEPQVLGQLKDAFEYSLSSEATGVVLNRLFKKAISVGKLIRTETGIAERAV